MAEAATFVDLADASRPLRAARLVELSGLSADDAVQAAAALQDAPAARRLQLVQWLVELSEDDATLSFDAIFTALFRDADGQVRREAINGVWESEDRDLIAPLIQMLQDDPDDDVRATAALALGRFVLLAEFDRLRPRDATAVLEALRNTATDSGQPIAVRARAIEAVGGSSEEWVRELIWRAYDAEERALQISALHAMGRAADPRWLGTLYDEMESDDPERRFEAAGAAGQIGDEDAIPALGALIEDEDTEVQQAAVQAIGEIGGDLAVDTLREHARAASPQLSDAIEAAIAAARAGEGIVDGVSTGDLDEDVDPEDDD